MAVFAVLELEDAVQIKDKTRFSAVKTYVNPGTTALTILTITPGADGSPISAFNASSKLWFLDWQFDSWSFDIDSTNNKIDVEEEGVEYVATLASGTYTFNSLLVELQTKLNTIGSGTYVVTADIDNKITITSDLNFVILAKSGDNRNDSSWGFLGFLDDSQEGITVTGKPVEYGIKKVTLAISNGSDSDTKDYYIKLYSEAGDRLFNSDKELIKHEKDILKWVAEGRSSYKDVERRAQTLILEWLTAEGYVDWQREEFTKWSFVELSEVRDWSTFMTLRLIFDDISNAIGDVFEKKARGYEKMERVARNRYLKIDIDGDGNLDTDEYLRIRTGNLFVR